MRNGDDNDGFFVGYINSLPGSAQWFVPLMAALMVLGFASFGILAAVVQTDPGSGQFLWDAGEVNVSGVLEEYPYPLIHAEPSARFPQGRTLMLSGDGKRGVQKRVASLSGQRVDVSGFLLKRGTIDMLQVTATPKPNATIMPEQTVNAPLPRSLGRWRLTGELCDGKCYAGAMRPGQGLAHKACANLCLIGGVPPVFVSTAPVEGHQFMMVADQNGMALSAEWLHRVAVLIEVEGAIEERGDLLIFKMDAASLKDL